jgi:hypothetical protein
MKDRWGASPFCAHQAIHLQRKVLASSGRHIRGQELSKVSPSIGGISTLPLHIVAHSKARGIKTIRFGRFVFKAWHTNKYY